MNNIKKLRNSFNYTQQELADKLELAKSTIAMYENGSRIPSVDVLTKLSNIFNVSTDYILGIPNYPDIETNLNKKLSILNLTKSKMQEYISLYIKYYTTHSSPNLPQDDLFWTFLNIVDEISTDYSNAIDISNNRDIKADWLELSKEEINENLKSFDISKNKIFNILNNLNLDRICVSEQPQSAVVFVYGTIPAGIPMECIEDIIDTEEIPADMLKGGKQYFGLLIKGNSMSPEYREGDIIILEKVDDCESGDECVVMVNGNEGTFKKVLKNENGVILQPLNPEYQPMVYTNEQIEQLPVRIIGKVVELRRKK